MGWGCAARQAACCPGADTYLLGAVPAGVVASENGSHLLRRATEELHANGRGGSTPLSRRRRIRFLRQCLEEPRGLPSWKETLSEWSGCVGVGLIPLITNLTVAVFTEEPKGRESLSSGVFLGETFLFCFVTTAAAW